MYCANRFAEKLAGMFPSARIELVHREQDIYEYFN